jgi:hypothetical protein
MAATCHTYIGLSIGPASAEEVQPGFGLDVLGVN